MKILTRYLKCQDFRKYKAGSVWGRFYTLMYTKRYCSWSPKKYISLRKWQFPVERCERCSSLLRLFEAVPSSSTPLSATLSFSSSLSFFTHDHLIWPWSQPPESLSYHVHVSFQPLHLTDLIALPPFTSFFHPPYTQTQSASLFSSNGTVCLSNAGILAMSEISTSQLSRIHLPPRRKFSKADETRTHVTSEAARRTQWERGE